MVLIIYWQGIIISLMDAGKTEEIQRALSDSEYRKKLYLEYFSKNL